MSAFKKSLGTYCLKLSTKDGFLARITVSEFDAFRNSCWEILHPWSTALAAGKDCGADFLGLKISSNCTVIVALSQKVSVPFLATSLIATPGYPVFFITVVSGFWGKIVHPVKYS